MVTCSNILAWKIPCTEEPVWLQTLGLQRVEHDWVSMYAGRHCKCYIRTGHWIFENLKLRASVEFKEIDFVMIWECLLLFFYLEESLKIQQSLQESLCCWSTKVFMEKILENGQSREWISNYKAIYQTQEAVIFIL